MSLHKSPHSDRRAKNKQTWDARAQTAPHSVQKALFEVNYLSTGKDPLGRKSAPPPLPLRFWGLGDPTTHLLPHLTDLTGTPAVELVRIRYASALRVRSFKFHQNGAARASTVKGRRHTK